MSATTKTEKIKQQAQQTAQNQVAKQKSKIDNIKSSLSSGLSGLLGVGAGLIANNFLSSVSGKLSQTPAMGIISKVATMAVTVKAVTTIVDIISKMNQANINLRDKVDEMSASGEPKTNITGEVTAGQQSEKINTDASGQAEFNIAKDWAQSQKTTQALKLTNTQSITPTNFSANTNPLANKLNYNKLGSNVKIPTFGGSKNVL